MSKAFNDIEIDKPIEDFMIGSRLGDGGFIKKSNNHNTYIVFSHCESQLGYLKWKYEFLNNKNLLNINQKIRLKSPETRRCYNNAQNQYYFNTKSLSQLNIYKEISICSVIKKLDELSFAIYLLDDGNFNNGCCKISCSRFTLEERNTFICVLKNKFNVECHIYNHPTNTSKDYFRINKKEYIKIKNIIINNIPNNLDVINKIYK